MYSEASAEPPTDPAAAGAVEAAAVETAAVEDVLVEDVSIDGMCGVY